MRSSHRIVLAVLVVALAAFAPPAAAAVRTTTTVMLLRASNAFADWQYTNGCLHSTVDVLLGTNVTRTTPGPAVPEQFGVLAFLQVDECTGQTLYSGVGTVSPPQSWHVAPSLGSAALRMDGTFVNQVDGAVLPMRAALTWTAIAAPTVVHNANVFHAPGLLFATVDVGIDRKASAIGTITVGPTPNLAVGTSTGADIVDAFSGSILVTRP